MEKINNDIIIGDNDSALIINNKLDDIKLVTTGSDKLSKNDIFLAAICIKLKQDKNFVDDMIKWFDKYIEENKNITWH